MRALGIVPQARVFKCALKPNPRAYSQWALEVCHLRVALEQHVHPLHAHRRLHLTVPRCAFTKSEVPVMARAELSRGGELADVWTADRAAYLSCRFALHRRQTHASPILTDCAIFNTKFSIFLRSPKFASSP